MRGGGAAMATAKQRLITKPEDITSIYVAWDARGAGDVGDGEQRSFSDDDLWRRENAHAEVQLWCILG